MVTTRSRALDCSERNAQSTNADSNQNISKNRAIPGAVKAKVTKKTGKNRGKMKSKRLTPEELKHAYSYYQPTSSARRVRRQPTVLHETTPVDEAHLDHIAACIGLSAPEPAAKAPSANTTELAKVAAAGAAQKPCNLNRIVKPAVEPTNGVITTRNGKQVTIHRYRLATESLNHIVDNPWKHINWREGMFIKVPKEDLVTIEEERERDENWIEAGKKLHKNVKKQGTEGECAPGFEKNTAKAKGNAKGKKSESEEDLVTVEITVNKKLGFARQWPEVLGVSDWNLESIKALDSM